MAFFWSAMLRLVVNERGTVAVRRATDFIEITVTEGFRTVRRRVYSRSPWMPELCAALGIENPFAP